MLGESTGGRSNVGKEKKGRDDARRPTTSTLWVPVNEASARANITKTRPWTQSVTTRTPACESQVPGVPPKRAPTLYKAPPHRVAAIQTRQTRQVTDHGARQERQLRGVGWASARPGAGFPGTPVMRNGSSPVVPHLLVLPEPAEKRVRGAENQPGAERIARVLVER